MTRFSTALFLALLATVLMVSCIATEEKAVPVNDEGEGNQCDQDEKVASLCLACSALAFKIDVNLVDCCTTKTVFQFCDACVNDREACENVMDEIQAVRDYSESEEDYYDDNDDVYDDSEYGLDKSEVYNTLDGRDKRYGTLFMNSPKRYGSLFFGKRAPEKRYGRVYMGSGSYFGKRSPRGFPELVGDDAAFGEGEQQLAKRFGYILGSSYKFGKRGDESEVMGYAPPPKRYGQLFMGGKSMFGKRDVAKRYGRLFLGSKSMFGKRDSGDIVDMDKRYGRLFTGRRRGSYFG